MKQTTTAVAGATSVSSSRPRAVVIGSGATCVSPWITTGGYAVATMPFAVNADHKLRHRRSEDTSP